MSVPVCDTELSIDVATGRWYVSALLIREAGVRKRIPLAAASPELLEHCRQLIEVTALQYNTGAIYGKWGP